MEEQCAGLEEDHAVLEEQLEAFESKCQQAEMQKEQVEEKLLQQKQVTLEHTHTHTPQVSSIFIMVCCLAQEMEETMQDLKQRAEANARERAKTR